MSKKYADEFHVKRIKKNRLVKLTIWDYDDDELGEQGTSFRINPDDALELGLQLIQNAVRTETWDADHD